MDLSPPPSSLSIQCLAISSYRRNTSSFLFSGKNIAATKSLSDLRVLKSSQILSTIKRQRPKVCCSNNWTNRPISRHETIQIQDLVNAEPDTSNTKLKKKHQFSDVLWRFIRPYVTITMAIGYICVYARTWIDHPRSIGWSQLFKALGGLVALSSSFCFVNAINQIFDVDIDRINKPDIPIASGEMSLELAWLITGICAAIGMTIAGVLNCIPFAYSIYSLYFLGTIYSVPPFNMKRSTLGAIIVTSLGGGLFTTLISSSAARASLGLPFLLSLPILFLASFSTLHNVGVAILKDISDVEGDKEFKVPTLAATIGVRNAAFIANGILLLNYISGILAAIFMPQAFRSSVIIPAHTVLSLCLAFKAWKLDKVNYKKEESYDFYQFVWNLMRAEYALFIFI